MKHLLKGIVAASFAAIVVSSLFLGCKDDDDDDIRPNIKTTTATFSGGAETPSIPSSGTGTAQISYDQSTKIISYTLTWQLGDPANTTVDMHFHGGPNASDAVSSPIVIAITGFSTASSGTLRGSTRTLTQEEENQFLGGKWYINIHSSAYPGGELRANIKFSSGSNNGNGNGIPY